LLQTLHESIDLQIAVAMCLQHLLRLLTHVHCLQSPRKHYHQNILRYGLRVLWPSITCYHLPMLWILHLFIINDNQALRIQSGLYPWSPLLYLIWCFWTDCILRNWQQDNGLDDSYSLLLSLWYICRLHLGSSRCIYR